MEDESTTGKNLVPPTTDLKKDSNSVRVFLAVSAVLLLALPFVVFLFTGNITVVISSTVLGAAIAASVNSVYSFYFRQNDDYTTSSTKDV